MLKLPARLAIAISLTLIALLVSGCRRRTTSQEITVGAFLSLSGSDSTFGTDTKEGIELAVEELNAAGGIKGKRVRVIFEDDKSTTQEASQKVRQLIDRDQVVALLGEVASSRSLAGGLIANTSHVPMVTPSSTAVDVTVGREWVFRTCFTDEQQGKVIARFVRTELHRTRMGIFFAAQDTYSSGLAASFRSEFTKLGGEIVVDKGYQKGDTNFRTHLAELAAHDPEGIFVPNYYNEMVLIARQAKELNIPGTMFVGGDGWDSANLTEGAGEELEGAYFTNHYAPDVPWENSKKFVAAYGAKYKHDPTSLAAQGYDAARLLFDAISRATEPRPDAIRTALAQTKDFQGATGTMTIGKDRNANKPIVIVQIRDKKFHYATQLLAEEGGPRATVAVASASKKTDAKNILGAILTGITQGAMIALVALGYTMVYGVLKLINFAHSEVFMMAAYFGLIFLSLLIGDASALSGMVIPFGESTRGVLGSHPIVATAVATALAMLAASGLGIGVERLAYRPLRGRGKSALVRVTPLVTALGMSVLLQNLAQLLFTARFRPYPQVLSGLTHVPALGDISTSRVLILVTAVVVMALLELVVKRTWFGKSMRALSANEEAARLMGVRTSRVIAMTFALGSSLAALGAVLFCLDQSQVYPVMGVVIGTRAFVAAVLGGIGSITGAMLGGLLIGVIGELVKLTDYSGGADVLVFVVLILVLLVRPAGLLGSTRAEKV